MRAIVLAVVLAAGCGDNIPVDDVLEAASGSRLKLEWNLYEDGTRQAQTSSFYDTDVHAYCTPQLWADGVERCAPFGEAAVFVDDECMNAIGRGGAVDNPTHFVGFDRVGGLALPSRLYRAGVPTTPISQYYELRDQECAGPFFTPGDLTYYTLVDELQGSDLVAIRDREVGAGRLGLEIRETDDGLRVPLGLRDRALDLACTPRQRTDRGTTCEPTGAVTATLFRDPLCEERVITIAAAAEVPTVATVADPSGCPSYAAVGPELTTSLYYRDGTACVPSNVTPPRRVFAFGAPIDLLTLPRTHEDVGGRRLQRIILGDDELRFIDRRLFDTATRADCEHRSLGDAMRCLPATLAFGSVLYTSGCALAVNVVEVAERTCEPIAFATSATDDGTAIHAIGDRVTGTLYHFGNSGACEAYVGTPDTVLRTLGPPIAPGTFMSSVTFGER